MKNTGCRKDAATIGIIGGADGPTSVFVGKKGRTYRLSVDADMRRLSRAITWTAAAFAVLLCLARLSYFIRKKNKG